jgi:hypothetical protein
MVYAGRPGLAIGSSLPDRAGLGIFGRKSRICLIIHGSVGPPHEEIDFVKMFEALAKLPVPNACHSERSKESRFFKVLRSFTSFRMTKK